MLDMFSKVTTEAQEQLQDYVLYPLELNLQRPNISIESKRLIIDCIKNLLTNFTVKSVQKFLYLYSLLFIQLFDKNSESMVASVSEEFKLCVIQCVTKMTQKCSYDIVGDVYKKENTPRISQGIFICVEIMQKEKWKSLKIAAIEFLMAITQVNGYNRDFDVWKPCIADTFMFIVPGILIGLHRVVVGDEKQGHSVTKTALQAWGRILILVLEDIPVEKNQLVVHFSAKVTDKVDGKKLKKKTVFVRENKDSHSLVNDILSKERTGEWAESVSENVFKMVKSLRCLEKHDHWKVRFELTTTCHSILEKCHQHLENTSIILIEILLKLSDDDSSQVASASQEAVRSWAKTLEKCEISFCEVLEDNFFYFITKMPRIFRIESDGDKLAALQLFKQYLILLGPARLTQLLHRSSYLQRIVKVLLQIAELQSSNLSLLNDCSLRDLELNQGTISYTPWKTFVHFTEKEITQKLEEVLELLGKNGDMEILCNYLLELLETNSDHRNEIVFILNELILGGIRDEDNIHIVKNILDLYLCPELWYVPLIPHADEPKDLTREKTITINLAKQNLQLACLLAQGVGNAATALGTHFSRFLMRCLYFIVERAGSPHEALTASGLKAAAAMAKATGQGQDITTLLSANLDYFMVQVSLRLRNLHRDPGVLSVLCVAMRHSTQEMLSYLQNAVSDVLLQCCDTFQMQHTSLFLHVFYTFFLCIARWFPNKNNDRENFNRKTVTTGAHIVDDFLNYMKNIKFYKDAMESGFDIECTTQKEDAQIHERGVEDTELDEYSDGTKKSLVPSYIQMTVSILQRCLHLLPRKDKQCQLQTLETITEGLEILADYEDELLPIIHQIWSPLVGRLQDANDPLLLNRSFKLLTTMARLARDFIRARTLKQVWTPLCSFLSETAEKSKNKSSESGIQHTQLFKLQLHLLQGLGDLVSHLQLREKEVYQILTAAAPYLSARQPKPLQENCIKLFQTIASYDANAVWLELVKLQYQLELHIKDEEEYSRNIESVYKVAFKCA